MKDPFDKDDLYKIEFKPFSNPIPKELVDKTTRALDEIKDTVLIDMEKAKLNFDRIILENIMLRYCAICNKDFVGGVHHTGEIHMANQKALELRRQGLLPIGSKTSVLELYEEIGNFKAVWEVSATILGKDMTGRPIEIAMREHWVPRWVFELDTLRQYLMRLPNWRENTQLLMQMIDRDKELEHAFLGALQYGKTTAFDLLFQELQFDDPEAAAVFATHVYTIQTPTKTEEEILTQTRLKKIEFRVLSNKQIQEVLDDAFDKK